ncbi:hypothetical protein [Nonomuraea sp. NPDC005692]|uniref:hypothetical protein n=1 Tax=Nonomuraea sp. NPDC005692 TaxID=3157168 RepID=UPI0033F2DAF0
MSLITLEGSQPYVPSDGLRSIAAFNFRQIDHVDLMMGASLAAVSCQIGDAALREILASAPSSRPPLNA